MQKNLAVVPLSWGIPLHGDDVPRDGTDVSLDGTTGHPDGTDASSPTK
jgi:hypothetical protein